MQAVLVLALMAVVASAHVLTPFNTVYPAVTYTHNKVVPAVQYPQYQYQYLNTKVPQYQYVPVQNKVPVYSYPYGYNYGTAYYNTPYYYV